MTALFWVLAIPALAVIALAAVIGARIGKRMDRAAPAGAPVDHKPRPLASRILTTLSCVAMVSALVMAAHRRNMDLYPMEGGVLMALFILGGLAAFLNRRVYGFWI
ncbi:MAG: hypothetical protein Q8R45_09575 [Brevundimonas sp.]|uniref:hypothetical protein n=1 Tax=Brevundimonas sp. TaxID=1871086 RepID=UPI00271CC7CE|nr:hypothetical protein [Brevundimonas sp.]MDO9587693.1 hypothetical protein [Brevundimonas sp.]MDP3657200.1 hypothetical protein [Brevundimonas sp.]MDZ4109299.1 hypothetical protein [Brevundimonas sp.]